ncbi:DUF6708 domain-containing protein [Pseudomonas sp. R5(2019)]|uniref:DUF6708 domain-containing protein n=1 Tax=Pseudomonas sp. R5(2019) TaxID=2697566 RepID=UPI00141237B5|nr:DUF6708 domain-containing protein [Pseudomonas sp. R5(2019)]NBA95898.1 hypothetical protein [Pseudomonas sp. R5(2019)]
MSQHHVPKKERSIFYTRVEALRTNAPPLNVEPAADNNVMKVTEHSLFMRTANGSMYGGRHSMSWWAAATTPVIFAFFSLGGYWIYLHDRNQNGYSAGAVSHYLESWYYPICIAAFSLLSCFWMFIPWRMQLPIIFNRKTRQVTCVIQGKLVSQHWDQLEAYIKDVTSFAVGSGPINEGVLTLAFPYVDPDKPNGEKCLRVGIYATLDHRQAVVNRGIYGAAQVWEYIRLYMREGACAVPPSSALDRYAIASAREAVQQFNPLKVLRVQHPGWLVVAVPFFLFIALPIAPLVMLGDIFYMWLNRILPRRKWPQQLIDACDGVWDGKGD